MPTTAPTLFIDPLREPSETVKTKPRFYAALTLLCWAATADLPAQITARFMDDFSASENPNETPNGRYEYRTLNGSALLAKTSSYLGGPAGWQESRGGPGGWTVGSLPGWGSRFYGHGPASVDWIAPATGTVTISGDYFKPDIAEQANRPTYILMKLKGTVFNALMHFSADWNGSNGEFNGSNPKPFSLGMGGIPALTFGVNTGDRITLTNDHWIMGDMTNSFCGFNVTIRLDTSQTASPVGTLYAVNDAFDTNVSQSPTSGPWSLLDSDDNLMIFSSRIFGGPAGWRSISGAPPAWQTGAFPAENVGPSYLYCRAPDSGDPGVQLRWTAPADGTAVIGGAISRTRFSGRNMGFQVEHNESVITDAGLPNGTGTNVDDPIQLFRMSGGPAALTRRVAEGDTIDFVTFTTSPGPGHFVRHDVYVFFLQEPAEPVVGSETEVLDVKSVDAGGAVASAPGVRLVSAIPGLGLVPAPLTEPVATGDGVRLGVGYLPALATKLSPIDPGGESDFEFVRGDCNGDGTVDISDATCTLLRLFAGRPAPGCIAAINANGDDAVDISDPTYLLIFLFQDGPAPVDPFPNCGARSLDTDQALGCEIPPKNCP